MDNIITTLPALREAVKALPPVAAGKVRVFRGQTEDYDTITPSSYRNHIALGGVWNIYSRLLVTDMDPDRAARVLASKEFQIQTLWLEAVAQHYGSGSWYLDVTHSTESAAWFALHRGVREKEERNPKSNGLAPGTLMTEVDWLTYSRAETGFLYAFDLERWDASGLTPPDLALVDLSNAPEPFRTPRMEAQLGCLIRAGEAEHYDLRSLRAAGTPLRVGWPMTGSEFVNRFVEEMFPEPAVDGWYRRFLSVPMMPGVKDGELAFQSPLPVMRYRGESAAYNAKLRGMDWFLDPPLLHEELRHGKVQLDDSDAGGLQARLMGNATPIILEAPVRYILPPAESLLWNHELLVSDLCDTAMSYSDKGEEAGSVALNNVVFQFSPLEDVFWERAEAQEKRTLRRGLWVMRQGGSLAAALIVQEFPGTRLGLSASGHHV